MAPKPVVIVTILKASDGNARSTVVSELRKVADYERERKGVFKYAICTVADNSDPSMVYTIQEFSDQERLATHDASPTVIHAMSQLLSASSTDPNQPAMLAQAPIRHDLTWTPAYFSKQTLNPDHNPNPFIIWATIDFDSASLVEKIAPYGAAVVEHARDHEPGCLFYGDARPRDKSTNEKGLIAAVEVYQDVNAFKVHSQGEALQAMVKEAETLGSKVVFSGLKMEYGWLWRQMDHSDEPHELRDGTTWQDG